MVTLYEHCTTWWNILLSGIESLEVGREWGWRWGWEWEWEENENLSNPAVRAI